jgi:hypothetical protein
MSRPNRTSNSARSADKPSASACRMKGSKSPAAIASDKVTRSKSCPLVMIEWEDSAQPIPSWGLLADFEPSGTLKCASVGWLIQDDDQVKALAPNMGAVNDERSLQVSGVMQIPASCVLRITRLKEPRVTCP